MNLVQTNVKQEGGSSPTLTVEFCGADGEIVSVVMNQAENLSREEAVARARDLMTGMVSASGSAETESATKSEAPSLLQR